jgi:hypothetical protein
MKARSPSPPIRTPGLANADFGLADFLQSSGILEF